MPARRSLVLALCGASVAVLPAGCGTARKPPDPKAEIRRVADEFGVAFSRRDGARICADLLTKRLRGLLEAGGLGCAAAMRAAASGVQGARLEVLEVGVDSKTAGWATVRSAATGQEPSTDRLRFTLESGGWRIASLDGPAPPAPTATP